MEIFLYIASCGTLKRGKFGNSSSRRTHTTRVYHAYLEKIVKSWNSASVGKLVHYSIILSQSKWNRSFSHDKHQHIAILNAFFPTPFSHQDLSVPTIKNNSTPSRGGQILFLLTPKIYSAAQRHANIQTRSERVPNSFSSRGECVSFQACIQWTHSLEMANAFTEIAYCYVNFFCFEYNHCSFQVSGQMKPKGYFWWQMRCVYTCNLIPCWIIYRMEKSQCPKSVVKRQLLFLFEYIFLSSKRTEWIMP